MTDEMTKNLGPLAPLVGTWEGEKGFDIAPSDDRKGSAQSKFREQFSFVPLPPVDNHEQLLYSLRYTRFAWRVGEELHFHEEVGYWHWDPREKQVIRSLTIPRGMTVLAGGNVEADANVIEICAERGSHTYGICSNKFLEREFQTVRYDLKVTINGDGSFSYAEDTQLKMKDQNDIFHHRDSNTLKRTKL